MEAGGVEGLGLSRLGVEGLGGYLVMKEHCLSGLLFDVSTSFLPRGLEKPQPPLPFSQSRAYQPSTIKARPGPESHTNPLAESMKSSGWGDLKASTMFWMEESLEVQAEVF